ELGEGVEAVMAAGGGAGLARGGAAHGGRRKLAFVFSGQGAQWFGMARRLLRNEPIFRQAFEQCERAVHAETGWSVREELEAAAEESHLDAVDVLQPTLFAIQVALAALWRSWGIEPDAVVGHSMGEAAASHVAGAPRLPNPASV